MHWWAIPGDCCDPAYQTQLPGTWSHNPSTKTPKIDSALLLIVPLHVVFVLFPYFIDSRYFLSPVLPESQNILLTLRPSLSQMGAKGCNYDCNGKKSFDQKWAWQGVCWGINVELTSSAAESSVEEEFRCFLQPQQCKAAIINKVFPRGC